MLPRLAVLGSGKGSNFVAIHSAIEEGLLLAEVAVVISDLPGAGILDHARKAGLPTEVLPPSRFKTKLDDLGNQAILELVQKYKTDWVILAGYMRVVKEPLLSAYAGRMINIHPSLLPAFPGLKAWEQALAAGVAETGCTVHYVTAEVDQGSVIGQRRVAILPGDTAESLHARIQQAEHELYPHALAQLFTLPASRLAAS
jgi:phosphoribosylglycinamide formyltransferase-1